MDASLSHSGKDYTLTLERCLRHAPEKVWRAITEKELLHQWFPAHVIGEWAVGAKLRFEFQHGEGDGLSEGELTGEVLTVEPGHVLEFRWGEHVLRCELVPNDGGCKLIFSETFADASWGARNAAGWELCLGNLELIVQGASAVELAGDAWRERFQHYVAAFQPRFGHQAAPPDVSSASRANDEPPTTKA